MLYVFYGTDVTKVRSEAHAMAEKHLAPGGAVSVITGDAGSTEALKDALGAASLFLPHEVFLLDMLSEDPVLLDALTQLAPDMHASSNHFIVIEGPLLAATKKVFEKCGAVCAEYKKTEKEFNTFALADALTARDKKTLWILLHDAWDAGKSSEEIIGTLFWQLKAMRLARVTSSPEEAGMKSYPYTKAKQGLSKYPGDSLGTVSHALLRAYHDARAGARDLDRALEAWVLSL